MIAESINTETAQRAQQHVRAVLQEIAELAASAAPPPDFQAGLISRVMTTLSAAGAAVWCISDSGKHLLPTPSSRFPEHYQPADSESQRQHLRLVGHVLLTGQPLVVEAGAAVSDGAGDLQNPTDFLLLLAPLRTDSQCHGVLEVYLRPGKSTALQQSYLRFIVKVGVMGGEYLARHAGRHRDERTALWQQIEDFGQTVHGSLELRQTAYSLANEAARLIDCDRVSVVVRHGGKTRVEAISGQDTVEHRATLVRLLNELTCRVLTGREPLWIDGHEADLAPQIQQALDEYVDQSHVRALAILPLVRPQPAADSAAPPVEPELIGALIVEQFGGGEFDASTRQRVDFVCRTGATALANALTYDRVFLMPLWRLLEKTRWFTEARRLPKTIVGSLVILAAILGLCVIPMEFRIAAQGTLQPAARRDVFVQEAGVVSKVLVDHGTHVHAGDVLLELESRDIDVALAEHRGRLASTLEQLASARRAQGEPRLSADERNRLSGQCAQLEASSASLSEQVGLLAAKRELLVVRSPIDGIAVTWDLKNRLQGRPVDKGQVLLTVANPDLGWELELQVPEAHSGYVARAWQQRPAGERKLDVAYILATDPAHTRQARVVELQSTAEIRGDEGSTVQVRAKIDPSQLGASELRPGATVTGQIVCGRRSIGYAWFHDVLRFIRGKVLFRI